MGLQKGQQNEQKMVEILNFAIVVLKGSTGRHYPANEGIWLLTTAFNRGMDCDESVVLSCPSRRYDADWVAKETERVLNCGTE
jgi:hypothetical protein